MTTQKVYIIQIGYEEFFTLEKDEAYTFIELVSKMRALKGHTRGYLMSGYKEKPFPYPVEIDSKMKIRTIDLYKDHDEAEKSENAYNKAKKMGLVGKGKKKSQ